MALTPEDGTGLANADALTDLATVDAYHTARGNSTWTGTDTVKEQAIRRASTYLSNSFAWQGYPKNGRAQAMAWPRYDVIDRYGYGVASDSVPKEIVNACAEIALRELVAPGSMNPDVTPSETVKRAKAGPAEIEFANFRTDAEASRPILLIVRDMVGDLLDNGSGSRLAGETVRI